MPRLGLRVEYASQGLASTLKYEIWGWEQIWHNNSIARPQFLLGSTISLAWDTPDKVRPQYTLAFLGVGSVARQGWASP